MTEKVIGIGSGYRSLDTAIEELEVKLAWAREVAASREQLDRIADIVKLGCLWLRPRLWDKQEVSILRLEYTGSENSHVDAAAHLSRILDALECTEFNFTVIGGGESYPNGEYRGTGKLGSKDINIELRVTWLPATCSVRMYDEHRTYRTEKRYSVYCKR